MDGNPQLQDLLKQHLDGILQTPGVAVATPVVSAGMQAVNNHLPNGAPTAVQMVEGTPQAVNQKPAEGQLTERQRKLPKLNLKLLAGVLTVLILTVGVGSATLLSQQSQDVRQQASTGQNRIVSSPQPRSTPVVTMPAEPPPSTAPAWLPVSMHETFDWLMRASLMTFLVIGALAIGFVMAILGVLFLIFRV